jgi:hypothetical protein
MLDGGFERLCFLSSMLCFLGSLSFFSSMLSFLGSLSFFSIMLGGF